MSAPATPFASARSLIAILIAVSIVNPLSINMFVPAMPAMMRSLATDPATIQLVLSAYLFATAAAQLILGPLSDRLGRRPVLIAGLVIYVAASLVCTLAPSIEALIGGRVLQGAGGCVGLVLGRAIIRDRYDREHAASMLGYVTMGFAVAPMVGPTIGGFLNDTLGWRAIFGLLTGLGVVVTLAAVVALPETRPAAERRAMDFGFWRSAGTLFQIPVFWAHTLVLSFATATFFCFLGGTPFVAVEMLGMSGTEYGLYFAFVPGGFVLGNFLTARYAARAGVGRMVLVGVSICCAAVAGMAVAFALGWYHPLSLFVPMYAIGFSHGLTLANSMAGAVSVRPEIAGAASGLAGAIQVGWGALSTVLIGALLGAIHSVFALIAVMGLMALLGLAAAIWAQRARGA